MFTFTVTIAFTVTIVAAAAAAVLCNISIISLRLSIQAGGLEAAAFLSISI